MKPPVPKEWIDGYFDDYDRLTSPERARRIEPHDGRLTGWLARRMGPDTSEPEIERTWHVVLTLIERGNDPATLAYVAAGPLEDLVRTRADRFCDRLIERIRSDPRFREAMRCIWGWKDVPEELRGRILPLLFEGSDLSAALEATEPPTRRWHASGRRPRT
jgi:hypothetical protein